MAYEGTITVSCDADALTISAEVSPPLNKTELFPGFGSNDPPVMVMVAPRVSYWGANLRLPFVFPPCDFLQLSDKLIKMQSKSKEHDKDNRFLSFTKFGFASR